MPSAVASDRKPRSQRLVTVCIESVSASVQGLPSCSRSRGGQRVRGRAGQPVKYPDLPYHEAPEVDKAPVRRRRLGVGCQHFLGQVWDVVACVGLAREVPVVGPVLREPVQEPEQELAGVLCGGQKTHMNRDASPEEHKRTSMLTTAVLRSPVLVSEVELE